MNVLRIRLRNDSRIVSPTNKKVPTRRVGTSVTGGQGFEPQPSDPESDVLPIKLSPIDNSYFGNNTLHWPYRQHEQTVLNTIPCHT